MKIVRNVICGSRECPRYYSCGMAMANGACGQVINYYTFGGGGAFTDANGKQHVNERHACGERGKWRMYEEGKPMILRDRV